MNRMKTFDDIEVRRPALAQSYLGLLAAQPGRPLALFAPRRIGKTFFLDHDLAPEAQQSGFLTIYADLWLNKSAPLEAINHALEEVLDTLHVPSSAVGRAAKTPVTKVSILGSGIELGEEPSPRPLPDKPALRLDALVTRLAAKHQGKLLLMLDEVQALADVPDGVDVIAALRAVLHTKRKVLHAVFTGSSQEGLAVLMTSVGSPMYQFAQILTFPSLGDDYLQPLANHFSKVHPGKQLDRAELRDVFMKVGFKPALMRDLVKAMSSEGITDVHLGLARYVSSDAQMSLWGALLNGCSAFDQGVLVAVAQGLPPLSAQTLRELAAIPGANPTIGKVRTALSNLKRAGILTKAGAGTVVDDPLFAEYLAKRKIASRAPAGKP